jgi:hypothetical protein
LGQPVALHTDENGFIVMRDETIDAAAQAAVVVELLNRPKGRTLAAVMRTRGKNLDGPRILTAADSLQAAGVIRRDGDRLYATPALDRLDLIGMVCI